MSSKTDSTKRHNQGHHYHIIMLFCRGPQERLVRHLSHPLKIKSLLTYLLTYCSDSQVNNNFPYWRSPANLTFNIYFYLILYLCITRRTIYNNKPHLKSLKNQNTKEQVGGSRFPVPDSHFPLNIYIYSTSTLTSHYSLYDDK